MATGEFFGDSADVGCTMYACTWILKNLEPLRGGCGGCLNPFFICGHFRKFHRGPSHGKKIKILWHRKCVRRGIFRTIEVRIEGRFVPFNPYFVCNTAIGSLCNNFYRKSYDSTIKNR